ncbi:hypothetical protein COLU111180_14225 [Cohnella lubricantis]|uniref:Uncharacterized protein n=1 Tax=Cohnella lubricantis TaxID=2163172 RepID=A0A841TCP5_9BACL|nr:hypothetical protein [Cohnella lubricantis]MBB6677779.1 hypothetical protein [Cohnella lubricantis]MBP2118075.1 hypothetical protein [Cohnella lubricantis]
MSSNDELTVPQRELAEAWRRTLPERLRAGDQAEISEDEKHPDTLLVSIQSAGRSDLEFDFTVKYVDSREIDIQLTDVERDGRSVDERTDVMQELIEDYRRHLHECAQALHHFTHA